MIDDPLARYRAWCDEEGVASHAAVPEASCLSTIGTDGYPNARFVAVKEVDDDGFVFSGPTNSRKGIELLDTPKAALTVWWPATERQVRMQGSVVRLGDDVADRLFAARPREARLVARLSVQGSPFGDPGALAERYRSALAVAGVDEIARPAHWGAWRLQPIRIEFLEFSPDRLHRRELYTRAADGWARTWLQP